MKPLTSWTRASAGAVMMLVARAYTATAQELFVSNEGSNTVTVISVATLRPLATIDVGKRPRGIALSPNARRVYVALGQADAVAVIDVAKRAVVDTLGEFTGLGASRG